MAKKLTELAVKNAQAGDVRQEIADGGQRGLYLVIQPSGVKSWACRYRWDGKNRKLTLGPYPELSLKDARREGAEVIRNVTLARAKEHGDPARIDPADARSARRRAAHTN